MFRAGCLAMVCAAFGADGRACVLAPSPASPGNIPPPSEAVAPPPGAGFEVLPWPLADAWNPDGRTLLLSSNLEIVPDSEPAPPDTPALASVVLPLIAILLTGAAWRYYNSPAYRRLYESFYGPLNQY